jgi:two-component system sensor histidine kinase KdpD
LPLISGEALLLEQVLLNLLENAARYAGRSATIFISARERKGLLSVRVADDGPGILESERGKVFEKFYRGNHSNRTDGGAGLGLTICRAIVEAHGGRIRALARAGGGALIEFTLPLAELPQIVREAS